MHGRSESTLQQLNGTLSDKNSPSWMCLPGPPREKVNAAVQDEKVGPLAATWAPTARGKTLGCTPSQWAFMSHTQRVHVITSRFAVA